MNMTMNEEHMACTPKTDSQRYRIGMFAAMNHITIKALRFYEEQGLLAPAYVEAENGYRYYTMSQMADVQQILQMIFKVASVKDQIIGEQPADYNQKRRYAPV